MNILLNYTNVMKWLLISRIQIISCMDHNSSSLSSNKRTSHVISNKFNFERLRHLENIKISVAKVFNIKKHIIDEVTKEVKLKTKFTIKIDEKFDALYEIIGRKKANEFTQYDKLNISKVLADNQVPEYLPISRKCESKKKMIVNLKFATEIVTACEIFLKSTEFDEESVDFAILFEKQRLLWELEKLIKNKPTELPAFKSNNLDFKPFLYVERRLKKVSSEDYVKINLRIFEFYINIMELFLKHFNMMKTLIFTPEKTLILVVYDITLMFLELEFLNFKKLLGTVDSSISIEDKINNIKTFKSKVEHRLLMIENLIRYPDQIQLKLLLQYFEGNDIGKIYGFIPFEHPF